MKKFFLAAAAVWTLLMLSYNLLKSYPALPMLGSFHADFSLQGRFLLGSLEKIKHWFFYSTLFCFVWRGAGKPQLAFAAVFIVGLLGEIEEGFFVGEAARLTDVVANMAAASVMYYILSRNRRKKSAVLN